MFGTENLQTNLDAMRGVEDQRVAEARTEQEEAEAYEDGVLLSRAAAAKRERNAGK